MPDPIAACGRSHSWRRHARNIAKRPGEGRGSETAEAQWPIGPWTTGQGITPPPRPRRTLLDNWSSSWAPGGWARLMAGSGRVSGAMVHVSKRDRGGVASVDRTLSTGDQRPAVVRGRTFSRHRRDNPGMPIPEETFTRSHPSWSTYFLYHFSPFATVHGILYSAYVLDSPLSNNLFPGPLWSSPWS